MEPANLNIPERQKSDFNLRVYLKKYLRYWYLFATALLLAVVVARYYNWYKNPIYAITSKLLVRDENAGKDKLLQQLDVDKPLKNIENEIEILRSHNLLAKALNELEFDVSYFLVGDVKISEVYKDCPFTVSINSIDFPAYYIAYEVGLIDATQFTIRYEAGEGIASYSGAYGVPVDIGVANITLQKRENFPEGLLSQPGYDKRSYRISFNTMAANQNQYLSNLSVSLSRQGGTILQLYLEDEVPQKGLDFLNKLVEVYLRNDIDIKNKAASATAVFLDGQLGSITQDLEQIETNRENFKVSKGIIDLESESQLVLESIREVDAQKALNSARLGMIFQLRKYIAENQDLHDLAPAALDIDDPLLIKLINKLSELQSQREIIIKRSTVNDPTLVPLNAEIELTRSSLQENIKNIGKSLSQKERELDAQLRTYKNRIRKIPTTERELLEIERRFRIQESLYVFLLEKRAELAISLAATESDTRIIDTARVLPGPVSPVPQKAYSVGIILAILLPVLLIFLLEKLNDRITDVATIRKLTSIPLLGIVRFNRYVSPVVALDKPRSSIAEEYRTIRTNLGFFQASKTSTVTMVTSSVGTEGKTFTAVNLAAVMAASGASTVLLGLDMRKPKIVQDFTISNDRGCSNYLSGNANLDAVLQSIDSATSLSIIPSGPTPPNPSELIMSPRMSVLIEELKARFDRIVIDTPPIGLVSDGLILANYADSVIFMVRDGVTRKGHLHNINDLYEAKKLKNVSIVFNALRHKNAGNGYNSGYGYGYGYGYVYGADYGNYFEEDEEGENFLKKWLKRLRRNAT